MAVSDAGLVVGAGQSGVDPSASEGSSASASRRSRAVYRSDKSTKRDGYPGGGAGPESGDVAVRFRWSRMSTGWPHGVGGVDPAGGVREHHVRHPAATAVRTPWTTVAGGWPS